MTCDASHESEIARDARALRDTIVRERHATESARRLAPPVHRALIDAGFYRLAMPREIGGWEASPVDALAVYEELAGADASVAWIVWNNSLPALSSKHLAPAAHAALLGSRWARC